MSTTQIHCTDVKVVVVGDGSVGKTCLCNVFVTKEFPETYEPTVFENYTQSLSVNGKEVSLQLWDTAGQEDYQHIRVLSYENTHCFVICFSVVDEITFKNLKGWLEEIRVNAPESKILLVGTKADLRKSTGNKDVEIHRSIRYKEVGPKKITQLVRSEKLDGYIETSAKKGGPDVDRVFYEAIKIALNENTLKMDDKKAEDCLSQMCNLCNIF